MKEDAIIAVVKNDIKYIKDSIRSINERLDDQGDKYASKWVETVTKFVGSGIGIAIIAAFMGLLLAKPAYAMGGYIALNIL